MNNQLGLLLLFSLFTISCMGHRSQSGPSVKPSEVIKLYSLLEAQTNLSELNDYDQEQLHPAVYLFAKNLEERQALPAACEHYQFISNQQSFSPVQELALVGQLRTCSALALSQFLTAYPLDQWPSWIEESLLRAILQRDDAIPLPQLIIPLVDYERTQTQKLELLERGLNTFPAHPELLLKREEVAPRFIEKPSHDQLFSVARDLEQVREFDQARKIYEQIISSPQSDHDLILRSFARVSQTYRVQRQREVYFRELDALAKRLNKLSENSSHSGYAEAYTDNRITKARALWTAHRRTDGQKILNELLTSPHPTEQQLAQIHFILAAMEVEGQNFKEAHQYYESGLLFDVTDLRLLENLLWGHGWNLYLSGDYQSALESFINGSERHPEEAVQNKFIFWAAQTYSKLNQTRLARRAYQNVLARSPYSYYGLVSRLKLGQPIRAGLPHRQSGLEKVDGLFSWLVFLNEVEAAKNALKIKIDSEELDPKTALRSYYQAEMFDEAIFLYNRTIPNLSSRDIQEVLQYGFPAPHLDLFERYGQAYGFPVELALSLTRQESAFNPVARSWADAFGLMQLIPERASELAQRLKLPAPTMDDLFEPELNIQLGIYHLAELKKRYNGQFPYYIAAYNAGDRPVNVWRQRRSRDDVLEFIENIPYRETQNYVKLIFRNAAIYRKLNSASDFSLVDLGLID